MRPEVTRGRTGRRPSPAAAAWLGLPATVPALLLAACSSGLIGGPKTQPEELERLRRQVVELRQRSTVAELEVDRLKRVIARLESELEEARRAPEPAAASEPNAPAAIGLGQEIEETDLEEAPVVATPPDVTGQPPGRPPAAASTPPPAAPAASIPTPAEAQALYDQGYTLFHEERYAEAEARFSRFVELHPRTDLADNALFWIGECRYARGDFNGALEAFTETVERYPAGNKVSDALLKAGKCLESLGNPSQARRTYEEVVERFPGSAAAAQARERLGELS